MALPACGGGGTEPEGDGVAAGLEVAGGDAQSGEVARPLPAPLEVRVVDGSGQGLPGAAISWVVVSGGGSVSPASTGPGVGVVTGSDGRAAVTWTLGTTSGDQVVEARLEGLPPAIFTARALPGPPATLEVLYGAGQTAVAGGVFPEPVRVRASDAFGNPAAEAILGVEVG